MKRSVGLMTMTMLMLLALAGCGGGSGPTGPTQGERDGLRLVLATPAAGSTIVVEDVGCNGGCAEATRLRFQATMAAPPVARASLLVSLLDEGGRRCAFDITGAQNLAAGRPADFESDFLVLECPLPFRTATVKAALIGDGAGPTPLLEATFPLRYEFSMPSPATALATSPRLLKLDWAASVVAADGCPLPGEGFDVGCEAIDDNGDAMTMTLRFANLGPGAISGNTETARAFPASPYLRRLTGGVGMRSPTDVRVTCEATDAGGLTTSRSIDILCGCGAGRCDPE
jgi:hypothetical protein